MTIQDITSLLSNVAFPIACCVAMGKFIYDTSKNNNENQKQFKEKQLDEIKKQTTILQSIADSLNKE